MEIYIKLCGGYPLADCSFGTVALLMILIIPIIKWKQNIRAGILFLIEKLLGYWTKILQD